jgi:hypothetical protein
LRSLKILPKGNRHGEPPVRHVESAQPRFGNPIRVTLSEIGY